MLFSRVLAALSFTGLASAAVQYGGVNEVGLESGAAPTLSTIPYWSKLGLNVFRIPFSWELAQPKAGGWVDETYLAPIDQWVDSAIFENGGIHVIIEPHNFARYNGKVIGVDEPIESFSELWVRLGQRYKDYPNVIFDLMNAPNDIPTDVWWTAAQAAIDAIRSTGAQNLILVPGAAGTGAYSWVSSGNADYALQTSDWWGNIAFDMQQFFDQSYNGTDAACVHTPEEVLQPATEWLKANDRKAFLTEFGVSTDPSCNGLIDSVGRYLEANADAWIGFTWWTAGRTSGNSTYSVEPVNGVTTAPQTNVLAQYFPGNDLYAAPVRNTTSTTVADTHNNHSNHHTYYHHNSAHHDDNRAHNHHYNPLDNHHYHHNPSNNYYCYNHSNNHYYHNNYSNNHHHNSPNHYHNDNNCSNDFYYNNDNPNHHYHDYHQNHHDNNSSDNYHNHHYFQNNNNNYYYCYYYHRVRQPPLLPRAPLSTVNAAESGTQVQPAVQRDPFAITKILT
ncbi:hypothetical protein HDV00_009648 [Rhizophlyctis rosea]|nr:hypothetical protein HDV00_009648 [Rhizophlyctis rosea]